MIIISGNLNSLIKKTPRLVKEKSHIRTMKTFKPYSLKEESEQSDEEKRKNEIFLKNMLKRMENKDKYI